MTRSGLEAVIREQLTRCVANAITSGVPSAGIMNRATETILLAAGEHASPIRRGPRNIHLITADYSLACGHDGRDDASSVPAEVTCPLCKAALAGRAAGGA